MFNLNHFTISHSVAEPILVTECVAIFMLSDDIFMPIKERCFSLIKQSFAFNSLKTPENEKEALDMIAQTDIFAIKKDWDQFCLLENSVKNIFKATNVNDMISFCEFPMNVRAVQSNIPKHYKDGSYTYPTDAFHSDIWGGEPKDTLQGFIYIGGDIEKIYLKLFEVNEANKHHLEAKTVDYKEMSRLQHYFKQIAYQPQRGLLILFDAIVPHQTFRSGKGVRVSLDFRFKKDRPTLGKDYKDIGLKRVQKYWQWDNHIEFNSYKEKLLYNLQNDYERFWYQARVLELIDLM